MLGPKASFTLTVERTSEPIARVAYYFRYWKKAFFAICLFGAIQFIVMTIIASFYYTGGSHFDPQNSGYTFMWNYVSDLGRTISLAGNDNLISRLMFTGTVTIAGLSVILFSIAFTHNYKKKTVAALRIIPLIFGILYGLDYILIGYLPVDTYYTSHNFCVFLSCFLKLITYIFMTILMLKDQNYPNGYAYLIIVYNVIFVSFGISMILALRGILPFLPTCITGQKVMFYLEAGLFTIQSVGALKHISQETTVRTKL